jgi:hypothetical protein
MATPKIADSEGNEKEGTDLAGELAERWGQKYKTGGKSLG